MKVQLATRVDQALRRRLRVHAAITGRTVEDLVSEALDGYLPPTAEMAQHVCTGSGGDALLAEQQGAA